MVSSAGFTRGRRSAAALAAGLRVAEQTAGARMQAENRELSPGEVTALLDGAVAFAQAGIARLGSTA